MSEQEALPPLDASGQSYSTIQAWSLALTRPNEATYQSLIDDPRAGVGRAVLWMLLGSAVPIMRLALSQLAFGRLGRTLSQPQGLAPGSDRAFTPAFGAGVLFCAIPLGAFFSVAGLFLYAGVIQFIAGAFGGQGSFARLAHAPWAFTAPLTIIGGFVSLIPFVNLCVALPLSAYSPSLNLLALKAVNRFGWGLAAATIGAFVLVSALFAVVLWLLLFRWIGPDLWSQLG
jgi:hypothetical protein